MKILRNPRKTGTAASESRTTPQTGCALGVPRTSNAHNGTERLCASSRRVPSPASGRASVAFALLTFSLVCATVALGQTATQPWKQQPVDPVSVAGSAAKDSSDIYLKVSRSTVLDFKPGFRRISVATGDIA
ncbi:MAG: hypothetical protein JO061_11620, partial [Acidobacteriaceae bacterium]|nr:hypothetical protein [Acidobacteriaceae bacterium]